MKRQLLLLFCIMASAIFMMPVSAQQLPSIFMIRLYDHPDDYIGNYWPETTDIDTAIRMDIESIDDPELTSEPPMRLFEGCDLNARIEDLDPVPDDTVIYMKFDIMILDKMPDEISLENYKALQAAITIPDSVAIPGGTTHFKVPYRINHFPDELNGTLIGLSGIITNPDGTVSSMSAPYFGNANIFNRFTYNLEYSPRTTLFEGYIKLNIQGGTSHLVCSFDGGYTWVKPQEKFTDSYLDKALEAGVIYIKEPFSCLLEAIPFKIGEPGGDEDPAGMILRPVTIPDIVDADVNYQKGVYYIRSTSDFVFTVRPTGTNAGLVPLVNTNRTTIPDSEGVNIVDNGDGSYTVTILHVQQPITVSVDFATGNESIENGNKVWANNKILYMNTIADGIANIYQATGILTKSMAVTAGETTSISLPAGFYIIKLMDGSTYKVVLK